jgi:uncharacterized protein
MNELHPSGIPPVPETNAYSVSPAMLETPTGTSLSQAATLTKDDRTMGMLCHLTALVGLAIPLGSILGPLIVWLTQKDKSEFIDYHGKESLNFHLTVAIMLAACGLFFFLFFIFLIGFLALPVMFVIGVYAFVMTIISAVKANEGIRYRYPMTIRFIR